LQGFCCWFFQGLISKYKESCLFSAILAKNLAPSAILFTKGDALVCCHKL
jgi:hypothetical protein